MHTRAWEPHHWSIKESGVVVAQLLSRVRLPATPWTAARQASLFFTVSRSFLRFLSIESVMLSNHLILCSLLLLLPSILPSIRVFSSESALCIRWLTYWHFSFRISPSSEYSGLISFRTDYKEKTNCRKLSGVLFCRARSWRSKDLSSVPGKKGKAPTLESFQDIFSLIMFICAFFSTICYLREVWQGLLIEQGENRWGWGFTEALKMDLHEMTQKVWESSLVVGVTMRIVGESRVGKLVLGKSGAEGKV